MVKKADIQMRMKLNLNEITQWTMETIFAYIWQQHESKQGHRIITKVEGKMKTTRSSSSSTSSSYDQDLRYNNVVCLLNEKKFLF